MFLLTYLVMTTASVRRTCSNVDEDDPPTVSASLVNPPPPKKLRTTLFGHYVSKPPAELGQQQQERRLIQYIDTINSLTFNPEDASLPVLVGRNEFPMSADFI